MTSIDYGQIVRPFEKGGSEYLSLDRNSHSRGDSMDKITVRENICSPDQPDSILTSISSELDSPNRVNWRLETIVRHPAMRALNQYCVQLVKMKLAEKFFSSAEFLLSEEGDGIREPARDIFKRNLRSLVTRPFSDDLGSSESRALSG